MSDKASAVKESTAAKRLSRTVNKMITKMDTALSKLEKKEEAIKETLDKDSPKANKYVKYDKRNCINKAGFFKFNSLVIVMA